MASLAATSDETKSLDGLDGSEEAKLNSSPNIEDITITELYNKLCRFGYFAVATKYIDLRDSNEFNKYHIATSVNVIVKNKEINSLDDLSVIDTIQTCKLKWHLKLLTQEAVIVFIGDGGKNTQLLISFLLNKYQVTKFMQLKPNKNGLQLFADKYPFMMIKGSGYKEIDESVPDYPHEIIKNKLYLGNYIQSDDKKIISNLQITHIVNVTRQTHKNKLEDIEYYQMAIDDMLSENLLENNLLLNTIKYIDNILFKENEDDNNKTKIMVHCHQGVSRSSSVVIGFLMYKYHVTFEKGLEMVESKRPRIYPNDSFRKQLSQFQQQLKLMES